MRAFSEPLEPLEVRRLLSVSPAAAPAPAVHDIGAAATQVHSATLAGNVATALPTPANGGVSVTEIAGKGFTARLGEIHFKVVDLALNALIHWGDGTHSDGTLVGSYATGEYYIQGTHTYAHSGTYRVGIDIFSHVIGSPVRPTSPVIKLVSIVHVLAPTTGGKVLTETAHQSFTTKLGEFTQKVIDLTLNAVVYWGDGTHSDGKLVGSYATGEWYVQGTHTYAHSGIYKVDVKIFAHPVGSPQLATDPISKFTSVINVKPLVPTAGGQTLTETAGQKFTTRLGEFTQKVIDLALNAVIDWGDGTKSDGKLVGSYATGEWYVQGTHTYAHSGTYSVQVNIYAHPVASPPLPTGPINGFTSVMKVNASA
jgi:hypothetical protein